MSGMYLNRYILLIYVSKASISKYWSADLTRSLIADGVTIIKTAQTKINVCTIFLQFSLNFVNETGLTENFATSTIISVKLGFKACVP